MLPERDKLKFLLFIPSGLTEVKQNSIESNIFEQLPEKRIITPGTLP